MTPQFLFAIEIGPVQEFIAAARKTRDLWFGSYVVSEVAKAVAREMAQQCGGAQKLIIPAPLEDAALDAGSPFNVGDVLLVQVAGDVVTASGGSEQLARTAANAAMRQWRWFADSAFAAAKAATFLNKQVWDDQVDDVVECYAAWVPLDGDYAAARTELMKLLGGRTACRNFAQSKGNHRVPKSSLDGARDTVLKRVSEPNVRHQLSFLRLTQGEQLDVVGVTKRLAVGRQTYPSVSRIAADPWLRGVAASTDATTEFLRFKNICDDLANAKILTRIDTARFPKLDHFPFEGSAVYRTRYRELAEESVTLQDDRSLPEGLRELGRSLEALVRRFGEANPYLAVLMGDGDRMSKTLDQLGSADQHREFSQTLAKFAENARQIVQDHFGALIYAGGDDVLGFVPLDQAVPCADALRQRFSEGLQPMLQKLNIQQQPTLSVGIGIGHFLEALEDLLDLGRDAEREAKQPARGGGERNALCVRLQPRGASPLSFRLAWDQNPHERLLKWAELLRTGKLPDKIAFDLRKLDPVYRRWTMEETRAEALRADITRILAQKARTGPAAKEALEELNVMLQVVETADDLIRLTDEIVIARRIAVALEQAHGQPGEAS